jgi:tripartite ATP-independent transporter DctM subunit
MIGPIIPPSIIMIIYGGLVGTSVAALFIAGILPGLLLAMALMALNGVYAAVCNHPGGTKESVPPFWPSLLRALPALGIPVVILGSLGFGLATPTEGSALAVTMALLVGALHRKLSWKVIVNSLEATASLTGAIFIILCAISILGYLAGQMGWSVALSEWVNRLGFTGTNYLLFLIFVVLIAGMFMDTPVALTLLVPLFVPEALAQGINPIHLGIVLCFNLCIGLISPPFGKCLVVVSALTSTNYWRLALRVLPFVALQIVLLLVLALEPEISLVLPRLFGFHVN